MPAAYVAWRTQVQHALLHLRATQQICDMPHTQPVCLTLHLQLKPRGGHPSDADNLAGGFMDAANGVLYTDDKLVIELHVTLDRHAAADAIHFDCHALSAAELLTLQQWADAQPDRESCHDPDCCTCEQA